MSTTWRDLDSDTDDEVFMGPVSTREIEISRMLHDETISIADTSGDSILLDLAGSVQAMNLDSTHGSSSLQQNIHTPVLSSTLLSSAPAPLPDATVATSLPIVEDGDEPGVCVELPVKCSLLPPERTVESREWEELPSECSQGELTGMDVDESRVWVELPTECSHSVPEDAPLKDSCDCVQLPSQYPQKGTVGLNAEESRMWIELPTESSLYVPEDAPGKLACEWEQPDTQCSLGGPVGLSTEVSRVWVELPTECKLAVPEESSNENSRRLEELRAEIPPQQFLESSPQGQAKSPFAECDILLEISAKSSSVEQLCSDDVLQQSQELAPDDTAGWCATTSDASITDQPAVVQKGPCPPTFLGTLESELAGGKEFVVAPSGLAQSKDTTAVHSSNHTSPLNGGSNSSGLLAAMQAQILSPATESVASFHTCHTEPSTPVNLSRRTTGVSEFYSPAAPVDIAIGGESARMSSNIDTTDENESATMHAFQCDAEESGIEEIQVDDDQVQGNAEEVSVHNEDHNQQEMAYPAVDESQMSDRTSAVSLTESEMRFSSDGDSQSECNNTLDMIEKLLELEAEERRMDEILKNRTAGNNSEEVNLPGSQRTDSTPSADGCVTPGTTTSDGENHDSAGKNAHNTAVSSEPGEIQRTVPTGSQRAAAGVQKARTLLSSKATPRSARTLCSQPTTPGTMKPSGAKCLAGATPTRLKAPPSSSRLYTPRHAGPVSKLATPLRTTPGHVTQKLTPRPTVTRMAPINLSEVTSPVARYIHEVPPPPLVQNLRPRERIVNTVVPQGRSRAVAAPPLQSQSQPQGSLQPVQEMEETEAVLHEATDNAQRPRHSSRIPVKVSTGSVGQENQPPLLPAVSYTSSGNFVMDETSWKKLVKKNTALNKKLGRELPAPTPVFAVKHTGHKNVVKRRVKWNDEFAVPDSAVKVRPLRRSISDQDVARAAANETSFMEVSVCEVKNALPALHSRAARK